MYRKMLKREASFLVHYISKADLSNDKYVLVYDKHKNRFFLAIEGKISSLNKEWKLSRSKTYDRFEIVIDNNDLIELQNRLVSASKEERKEYVEFLYTTLNKKDTLTTVVLNKAKDVASYLSTAGSSDDFSLLVQQATRKQINTFIDGKSIIHHGSNLDLLILSTYKDIEATGVKVTYYLTKIGE